VGGNEVDSEIFRQNGHRLTAQRDLVLKILEEGSGHLARNDIYERIHSQLPMVNRSTIYRTLDILEELGVVRHVHDGEGATRYHRADEPLHLHLYCHRCDELIEIGNLPVSEPLLRKLREEYGFEADLTHFPIAGLCAHCAETAETIPEL
jgi:Fur family ferric uptake transcriptional regulator